MYQCKKIIVCIPLLLLMLSIFGNSLNSKAIAALTPSLYANPSHYDASSLGETVPIQVNANWVFNLTGYQFELRFNTTLLQCLNASMGSFFPPPPNSTSTVTIDNSQGIISIIAHLLVPPVGFWGTLLSVNFNATYATTYPLQKDTCALAITNDTLYGIGSQPIPHSTTNGVYNAPYAPPQLNLTLNTDRNIYHFEERININGTLTGNGYPIPDALVALEIQAPNGDLKVARTFQTSSIPVSCPFQITALTPCDSLGNPQSSFQVGSFDSAMHFYVEVKNTGSVDLNVLVTVNPYDSSNASLGARGQPLSVAAGGNNSAILSLPLDYGSPLVVTPATSGNAAVYASVWTDHIPNGGIPLALERQATFTITGTTQGTPILTNPPPQGTYETSFTTHFKKGTYSLSQQPNYAVNVEAKYIGNRVAQSKQIQIRIAGDINLDGQVGLNDLVLMANAYGTTPASGGIPGELHAWNPNADINNDGVVGLPDLVFLARNYGKGSI
jgi:hypothetical protein